MSQEITATFSLSVANGGVTGKQMLNIRADQTTKGYVVRSQTIPTSDTVITLTGVTQARWVSIINRDSANFIDIGPTVAGAIAPMIRLKAGEGCTFPIKASTVLRGQADTAGVPIEIQLLET